MAPSLIRWHTVELTEITLPRMVRNQLIQPFLSDRLALALGTRHRCGCLAGVALITGRCGDRRRCVQRCLMDNIVCGQAATSTWSGGHGVRSQAVTPALSRRRGWGSTRGSSDNKDHPLMMGGFLLWLSAALFDMAGGQGFAPQRADPEFGGCSSIVSYDVVSCWYYHHVASLRVHYICGSCLSKQRR